MKQSIKAVAIKTVLNGGKELRKHFLKVKSVKRKTDQQNIVTEADLFSEKAMIETIKKHFPVHSILSEESGKNVAAQKDYLWIIDPLDGTANYASGNPYFSVSVAVQYKGNTIIGIAYNPISKELFIAEKGKGVTYNGKRTAVSKTTNPEDAIVCVDWNHYQNEENRKKVRDILYVVGKKARRVFSYGSAVLSIAQVSAGMFDAYFNLESKPWDHAAASLIVQEAGGIATTFDGKEQKGLTYSVLACNNKKIHNYLIKNLN